jgi:uncharacterized membrane protein YeaQ/YmgE (transglycosylase-associated protein family)
MSFIWTLVIGFFAGLVGKLFISGRKPSGCILTTLLGIIGSVVATYLGQYLGIYEAGEPAGFVGAVIGVIIVLLIYKAL